MNGNKQISETLLIGAMLAMVGGFLDAYTYICRGGVFANAQTGNIVLVGIRIAQTDYKEGIYHLIPVVSFFMGIVVAEHIRRKYKDKNKIHWRQIIIAFEAIVLASIAFIPNNHDVIANILVSFVCSMQVQSFRKINGNAYATTMCTGNLRSGTESLYEYKASKNRGELKKSLEYYGIIAFFILGAAMGTLLIGVFGNKTIFFACGLLTVVFAMMFIKE
ncbi:MAG: YoaK family protein [Anaerotignaceae bacterium]